jgi:hypothetical protein
LRNRRRPPKHQALGRVKSVVFVWCANTTGRGQQVEELERSKQPQGNATRGVSARLSRARLHRHRCIFQNDFNHHNRKSLSRGASPERLWGISERASVRLVFLFLGGFLLGCHEVFPPFERFVLPRFDRAP